MPPPHGPDQLVEGIVAAHIFIGEADDAIRPRQRSDMDRASLPVERLMRGKIAQGAENRFPARVRSGGHGRQGTQRLFQIFNAAQTTGGIGDAMTDPA